MRCVGGYLVQVLHSRRVLRAMIELPYAGGAEQKLTGSVEDPVSISYLGALFGSPADRDGPVALRPQIALGLPVRRISIRLPLSYARRSLSVNPNKCSFSRSPCD